MDKVSVAVATADDIEPMVELLAELFAQEQDFSPDPAKQEQALRLIVANPAYGHLFVLKVNDETVGMANALITVSTAEGGRVLLLEDVILKRDWRGRGLGRRLLEHVFDWAAGQGMARVSLLTDADNAEAQAFYRRLDFQPSAMRLMRKRLAAD